MGEHPRVHQGERGRMIHITVNINGSHAWVFQRLECLFRGHEWTTWYSHNKTTRIDTQWIGCSRCNKKQPGTEKPRER